MAAEQPSCADFQFNPPEDRLILEYLRPFALGRITGAESVINDDPYRAEPWELLAEHQRDIEESAFFFARKTMVGTRRSRTVGENGTWRTQNSEKRAVDDGGGRVVAVFRKTLLSYYYLGGNQIMSTGYVMYEYELYVDSDGRGGGGGTYDSMLCHVKKSCREVARSNKRKRKREFQSACNSSGIECNPYPYSAAAASSLPGCRSLCPCEAPVVIDSADGLPESRARIQQSAISLSENSQWRGLPEPACEAPVVVVVVVVDDTDANRNSMISLSRSPELKARNEMSGTPESKAISETSSEALAVANANYAASQSETKLFESASEALASSKSANAQSGPPSQKAILDEPSSEATTNITSTDLSRSKLQTISQPTFGSKDAAFLVLLPSEASSDGAETPSENKPQQEEPPSDSSNKSETLYSVGELIDILVTADPAATRIFDHLRELRAVPFHTIVID